MYPFVLKYLMVTKIEIAASVHRSMPEQEAEGTALCQTPSPKATAGHSNSTQAIDSDQECVIILCSKLGISHGEPPRTEVHLISSNGPDCSKNTCRASRLRSRQTSSTCPRNKQRSKLPTKQTTTVSTTPAGHILAKSGTTGASLPRQRCCS